MPLAKESYSQILDGTGTPYAGAKLYAYDEATSTPKDTYTTRALSTANANPVVADGNGRFPAIWLGSGRYKFIAKTSADVTIYTADGIEGTTAAFPILSARGDLLTHNGTDPIRLALGAAATILTSNGTDVTWGSGPSLGGTNVWTAPQTFQMSDDGAAKGPLVQLNRISASPATNDEIGAVQFFGRDSGGNPASYAEIIAAIVDPTDGSGDGQINIRTVRADVLTDELIVRGGAYLGAATGGAQGVGTLNATEYYRNGTVLPFTKSYASTGQTISNAGGLTLAHGMGVEPKMIRFILQCTSAEHGWSVGNRVEYQGAHHDTTASAGNLAASMDATNITIRFGAAAAPLWYVHATTGASVQLTAASWQLYVQAYA